MTVRLSPGSSGELVDPDGHPWAIRRKRLPIRTVRDLLRHPDLPVIVGEGGGFDLRWVPQEDRAEFWQRIRHSYVGSKRRKEPGWVEYIGHEFADEPGGRLLYVEVWC